MFKSQLILQAGPGADEWTVRAPLIWSDAPDLPDIVVPNGFVTDLASIPRIFCNLPFLDPNGLSRRPAVLHDYLYNYGKDKETADLILQQALIQEGCSKLVAWMFYKAVDLFGEKFWQEGHSEAPKP